MIVSANNLFFEHHVYVHVYQTEIRGKILTTGFLLKNGEAWFGI